MRHIVCDVHKNGDRRGCGEKWEFTFVGVCENGEKLKGLAAASLRLKTLNDNP